MLPLPKGMRLSTIGGSILNADIPGYVEADFFNNIKKYASMMAYG